MGRMLVIGCGYVGGRLCELLLRAGHEVWGMRRSGNGFPAGVRGVVADVGTHGFLDEAPGDFEGVFYLVAPDGPEVGAYEVAYLQGLENLIAGLGARRRPRRIFLASSTSVYGDRGGASVDETAPPAPDAAEGEVLLRSERLVADSGIASTVVRVAGLYGPQRTGLVEAVRRGEACCGDSGQSYGNRIHRDDCARAFGWLASRPHPDPLYLATDDEPAARCEVLHWLAARLGAPNPHRPAGATARRFRGNKRCSNRRLCETGWRPEFPSFREGYAPLLGMGDT